jgi:hypothetical protein
VPGCGHTEDVDGTRAVIAVTVEHTLHHARGDSARQ